MKPFVSFPSGAFLAGFLLVTATTVCANIIEPTPTLPPTVGGYVVPTICITPPGASGICIVNGTLMNFIVSSMFVTVPAVQQEVNGTASFTGALFPEIGGQPGPAPVGTLSAVAAVGFIFSGRSPTNLLG